MARRDRNKDTSTTDVLDREDVSTPPEEAPAVSTATEAPADTSTSVPAQAEGESASGAAKSEEVVIDLTGFKAAVEAAVAGRDTSTGEVPEALVKPVQAEYRNLGGLKPKN